MDAGTGASTIVVEATDPNAFAVVPVLQNVLWWTVSGLGLALDLYGFAEFPTFVALAPIATPYGLPGETDVRLLFRSLAIGPGSITPPFVFLGRGGDDLVIVTEPGGWTNVSPTGPLTDSYTVRLSHAATATVYITFTSAYGSGPAFAQFSIDGGRTWVTSAVLAIAGGDTSAHTILVRWSGSVAALSALPPGSSVMTISHTVSSADPDFDGASVRNVYVNQFKDAFLPPPPSDGGGPGTTTTSLAATGSTPIPTALLALLALLMGALALLLARRRRSRFVG